MAQITLLSKPGCHLCDDVLDQLLRVRQDAPFELIEVDIRHDPQLLAEYGEQIPVVLLNGEPVFEYAVDEARLRTLLKEVNA